MKEKIIYLKTNELKPYENNPRYNESAIDVVAKSIQEFGFRNPIIVDSNMVIIAGHTRLEAAKQLGIDEVPVIVADDLSEDQANALRLVDNKTAESATWNFEKLKEELDNINMDLSDFDFDTDFEPLKADLKGNDPEYVDEEKKEFCTCPNCGLRFSPIMESGEDDD